MEYRWLNPSEFFMYLTLLILGILVIYGLSPIVMPFIWALILAYLFNPMVRKLEATKRFSRIRAVVLVFSLLALSLIFLLLIIMPIISNQISALLSKLPHYLQWIDQQLLRPLSKALHMENLYWDNAAITQFLSEHLGSSGQILKSISGKIIGSAGTLVTFIFYALLIPVVAFYLMCDWEQLMDKLLELIPRKHLPAVTHLVQQSDFVLSEFLRGQLLVMLALAVLYSLALSLLGLDMAMAIGLFAGLISFVPYLGLILGMSTAGILAVLQFQDIWHLLGVVVAFMVVHGFELMFLTPKLVGDKTGLHPVMVMFAILAGGHWFGFTGILVALPVAAVLNVILSYYKQRYLNSHFYLSE